MAFLLGISLGAASVALVIYFNPLTAENSKVGINPTPDQTLELYYGSMLADSIAFTNSGNKYLPRRPADIEELWHPTLKWAQAAVQTLMHPDESVAGIGVKLSAWSPESRPLMGKWLMNSVWYIYLPGSGGMFVEQKENYWPFVRSVALPAFMNGEKTWEGKFATDLTTGPGPAFEGRVVGASGVLRGHRGEAREAIAVSGFSMGAQHTTGKTKVQHSLTLAISAPESEVSRQSE